MSAEEREREAAAERQRQAMAAERERPAAGGEPASGGLTRRRRFPVLEEGKFAKTTVRFSPEVRRSVDVYCMMEGKSLSMVVEEAVLHYFEALGVKVTLKPPV